MVHDPQFWVALAFLLFVAAIFKPVGKILISTLDGRAAKIQQDLGEASRLREEAQQLLASYQRKQKEAVEEAKKIVKNAESEATRIITEAEESLEENLNKRIQIAMQKIATYEHAVMQEIRTNAIDMAINTVRQLVKEKMSKDISEQLVVGAISEMHKKLH